MKKILAISVAAAMLLAVGATAFASATSWTLSVKASNAAGTDAATALTIGTGSIYTDGLDSTKGEPGNFVSPPSGKTLGVASTWITGAAAPGYVDQKSVITGTETKTWEVHLYTATTSGPTLSQMKVVVTPGASTYAPVYAFGGNNYTYTFEGAFIPGGKVVFDKDNVMTAAKMTWTLDPTGMDSYANGAVMKVTVAPVPEPSSIVAMLSGLVGMAGFAIRRRK